MLKRFGSVLVVGTYLVAGAATAQTNVILYGIADGNLRFDHTNIGTLRSVGSGGESASRWGIRGTEDLGGGTRAMFVFEQDLDLSDNGGSQGNIAGTTPSSPVSSTGSRIFGRRAIVGLGSTSLGEIRLGREYTPFYQTWLTADPFGSGFVGRVTNIAVGNVTRADNSITYESPSVYGVRASVQYRAGESTTNNAVAVTRGGEAMSASLTYASGPVYLGLAGWAARTSLDNNNVRTGTAVATYDFNVVKAHVLYFNTRNRLITVRRQAYAVGATVPISAFRILALAGRVNSRDVDTTTGNRIPDDDATFFSFATTYAFSKRTDLYMSGAKFKNGGAANFTISDSSNSGLFTPANVPAGFDPWAFQFGVRHLF